MSTVKAGALVTVQVGVTSQSYVSPQTDFEGISNRLSSEGLQVRNYSIEGGGVLAGIGDIITAGRAQWNLTVTVEVTQNYIDGVSDDSDDVGNSIRNKAYETTGTYPVVFSITKINGKDTGSPAIGVPGGGSNNPITGGLSTIGDSISGFFSTLKSTTTVLLIVGVAIVILVLVLAAYGPNVKHIAAAARPV